MLCSIWLPAAQVTHAPVLEAEQDWWRHVPILGHSKRVSGPRARMAFGATGPIHAASPCIPQRNGQTTVIDKGDFWCDLVAQESFQKELAPRCIHGESCSKLTAPPATRIQSSHSNRV